VPPIMGCTYDDCSFDVYDPSNQSTDGQCDGETRDESPDSSFRDIEFKTNEHVSPQRNATKRDETLAGGDSIPRSVSFSRSNAPERSNTTDNRRPRTFYLSFTTVPRKSFSALPPDDVPINLCKTRRTKTRPSAAFRVPQVPVAPAIFYVPIAEAPNGLLVYSTRNTPSTHLRPLTRPSSPRNPQNYYSSGATRQRDASL